MTNRFLRPADPVRAISARKRHKTGAHGPALPAEAAETRLPFTLAAPSFVIPAGVAENARFLARHFAEIGLLFFETRACLDYTDADLPPDLAELPVSWHVHLPLDLPWDQGIDPAWEAVARLMDKGAFLRPHAWVLHPPAEPGQLAGLAARLREAGMDPADILLENVEESDLCALWDESRAGGFSTCLDLGHILAYDQRAVLDLPGLWETVRMLHVYAPGQGGRHAPLDRLDTAGQSLLRVMLGRFQGQTVTVEVFDKTGIFESIALLGSWLDRWEAKK
jgi:hypothetical protein